MSWVIPVSFGTGAVCGLTWIFLVGPIARRRVEAHVEEKRATELIKNDTTSVADPEDLGNTKEAAQSSADSVAARDDAIPAESMQPSNGYESFMYAQYKKFADSTFDQDLAAESMRENPKAAAIWANAEVFDEHAEQLFTYVQVFTPVSTRVLTVPTMSPTPLHRCRPLSPFTKTVTLRAVARSRSGYSLMVVPVLLSAYSCTATRSRRPSASRSLLCPPVVAPAPSWLRHCSL